ncbi:MAG: sulfotransferase, partial [Candidatus Binatia bacterium]
MSGSPIFIGGTGRSGTTILKRILVRHPAIFGLREEARFMIDPDGLISLVDALSTRWSPGPTDKALRRFEALMKSLKKISPWARVQKRIFDRFRVDLFAIISPPEYASYDLGRSLGYAHFDSTLERFMGQLVDTRFPGRWPGSAAFRPRPVVTHARRFAREEIAQRSAGFVHELLSEALRAKGASRWCDDTPMNLLQIDFLRELFPDLRFIHIFR